MAERPVITAWATDDQMNKIRELVQVKDHKLAAIQRGGSKLSAASAYQIIRYLESRPDKPGGEPAPTIDTEGTYGQLSAAAQTLAQAVNEVRQQPRGFDITEEGIFYYKDTVYKVFRSQYPPHHWRFKMLSKETRKFTDAPPGMTSVLREEHRMTPEQSRQYEKLYDFAPCTSCGAELEREDSRERRYGPVCWGKKLAGRGG